MSWRKLLALLLGIGTGISITIGVQLSVTIDVTPEEARCGWAGPAERESIDAIAATMPKFAISADPGYTSAGATVHLWDYTRQVLGTHYPTWRQETGDCVSMGAANALAYLQCVQIARDGQKADFRAAHPSYIYGMSRTAPDLGNKRLGSSAGSVGAWAAEAVRTYGVLPLDWDGVPEYSGQLANAWGSRGPPAEFIEIAKRWPVRTVARVQSYTEVRDALANGYPVTVASNRGFKMSPRVEGGKAWGIPSGNWNHQMCLIAVDDSGRRPGCYCLNSWGADAHGRPAGDEPPGGFWIDDDVVDAMARQGDSWAFSGFEGFPRQELDVEFKIFGQSAPPTQTGEVDVMQIGLLALGLLAVGFLLVLLRRGTGRLTPTMLAGVAIGVALSAASVSAAEPCFNMFGPPAGQAAKSSAPCVDCDKLCFAMFGSAQPKTEPAEISREKQTAETSTGKPKVFVYRDSRMYCPPCDALKSAAPRLPVELLWRDPPEWVEGYPTIHWRGTDGRWFKVEGWDGQLERKFLRDYAATTGSDG